VLIVEQNIRQVLKVVGRAYLLEAGRIRLVGNAKESSIRRRYAKPTWASEWKSSTLPHGSDPERPAARGLLALLSLGLNLIFGVIDVVWICYAELIMCACTRCITCTCNTTGR